jgi:plasmid stabilization system protein ParE
VSTRRYRLVIRPEAHAEVAEAAQWYDERSRGLGRDFLRAFRAATDVLRRNPYLYQIIFEDMRRVVMRRFPYSVFYEIHEPDVVVLGCMHEARDPEDWQKRASG